MHRRLFCLWASALVMIYQKTMWVQVCGGREKGMYRLQKIWLHVVTVLPQENSWLMGQHQHHTLHPPSLGAKIHPILYQIVDGPEAAIHRCQLECITVVALPPLSVEMCPGPNKMSIVFSRWYLMNANSSVWPYHPPPSASKCGPLFTRSLTGSWSLWSASKRLISPGDDNWMRGGCTGRSAWE